MESLENEEIVVTDNKFVMPDSKVKISVVEKLSPVIPPDEPGGNVENVSAQTGDTSNSVFILIVISALSAGMYFL